MGDIPTEFRYWERISDPAAQRQRQKVQKWLGFDPVLPDELVRTWARTYYDADPVAEAFVDEVYLKDGQAAGRAQLDKALAEGVSSIEGAAPSLVALCREMEEEPSWLDWEKVELGARVFRRFGTRMFSFAGAVTLEAYQENSVAKPLAFTGAYTGESAHRRFLETGAFWIDVAAPGALRRGGKGVKTALRVRVMHVFVRRRLLAHPEWRLDAWGVPISQGDALLTLLAGSVGAGLSLKMLGFRTSHREIEAMMHFWRYIGHLMGVQPRFYPETFEDGVRVMFASFVKGAGLAGEDGKNLAHSYVASYAPREGDGLLDGIRKRIEYGIELGYTRFFLPPRTYRKFGLPDPGLWRWHPYAQFPLIFALETVRKNVSVVDDWVDGIARWETQRWLDAHLGKRAAEYKAVEAFTR